MGKSELRRIYNIIDKNDDNEKETYLKELGKSVHNYIRTGVKNSQLDDLIELEEEFKEKYEERFNVKEITNVIFQLNKSKMDEFEKKYMQELKRIGGEAGHEREMYELNMEKASNQIAETVMDIVHDKLQRVIKDTAYLSHMNMLYELYEQEEYLRREEAEYDKISEKFQKMADIAKSLSKEKRMKIQQLQRQVDISEKELEDLLIRHRKYFNVREKQEDIQISLSPVGKKYYNYIMDSQEKYSKSALNQIVYKNCEYLMESFENSFDRGIEYELKLEEISRERDRALQVQYHRIIEKIKSVNEEIYTAKEYIIKEEKESMQRNNGKNKIRIPRRWDSESI